MHEEEVYICWFEGQEEDDGKEIKADNPEDAARTAVDIWRHENVEELGSGTLVVYVKDEDLKIQKIAIRQSGDSQAPEATL